MDKTIKKVNFSEYKNKYDEKFKKMLLSSPKDMDLDSMRTFLYGYTFTEDYAKCIIPDELSMDYWHDKYWSFDDDSDTDGQSLEIDETTDNNSDSYFVDTIQEILLLETIDSTGDGKSPETALCVIDVHQEYEYLSRVDPYIFLNLKRQSVKDGIDCLEFEPNSYGIEHLYFDISRRFEVGYPI